MLKRDQGLTSRQANSQKEELEEHSFDELSKALAMGSMTRGRMLRLVGAAMVGGLLTSVPGIAWAASRRPRRRSRKTRQLANQDNTFHAMAKGGGGGKSACAKLCQQICGTDEACQEQCTSQGAHGAGPCKGCTPGTECGTGSAHHCTCAPLADNSGTVCAETTSAGSCADCPVGRVCVISGGGTGCATPCPNPF